MLVVPARHPGLCLFLFYGRPMTMSIRILENFDNSNISHIHRQFGQSFSRLSSGILVIGAGWPVGFRNGRNTLVPPPKAAGPDAAIEITLTTALLSPMIYNRMNADGQSIFRHGLTTRPGFLHATLALLAVIVVPAARGFLA